jgi:response regulator RpfG family c-di-GMP phosphodiesterase
MKMHPQYARDLLLSIHALRDSLEIPYCHHERWDGNGYPRGLKGEEIPLAARLFTIIDVWDALNSDRCYRPAWNKTEARAYIEVQSGKQFDPQVVHAFLGLLDELAAASLAVELGAGDGSPAALLLDKEDCRLAADQLVPSVGAQAFHAG